MADIKYNNVATVSFKSEAQCARFVTIIAKQPTIQACRIIHGNKQASLLVPQDCAKDVQITRMFGFRSAAKLFIATEKANHKPKQTRQKLRDVLESFAPLSASDDSEARHHAADLLLCSALEILGQHRIVKAWRKVKKHYA